MMPSNITFALRLMVMFTGSPDRPEMIPDRSHPPRILLIIPWLRKRRRRPKGSWYTALVVKVCRTSWFVLLRSQARHELFSTLTDSPAPIDASVIACDHM